MAQDNEKAAVKEQMAGDGLGKEDTAADSAASEARRKAVKAGLIGAPLLLTLRSAPAWTGAAVTWASGETPADTNPTQPSTTDPQPPGM